MSSRSSLWLGLGIVILFIATPAAAFGAGDIIDVSNIDNVNYRHGDIENTLLELIMAAGSNQKFEKLDVKRVYFGNWLRDYSQAIDVGGLKQLPAETIRILLWCLSFITFGYATGEFEVTADRLGCYRPEEHIDNPKDYADNLDAREYDQRLRGPVNEELELKVNPETGLKTYIASENAGCDTSAGLVRCLFEKSIELGRKFNREHNNADLYEALRLLGTGLHCLEDFSAHSNYTELALRELGVDAFPHVGKNTEIDVRGKRVFPIVTGTFGMTDFLHSVVGELGDKVAQSEVEDMESKLTSASEHDAKNDQKSVLKSILDKVPWDLLEGDGDAKPDPGKADELKQAAAAKAQEAEQHPLDPNLTLGGINIEEAKQMAEQTAKDMYPILEFHDQIMKGMTAIMDKVPGLDELLENMSGALQIFIFSLLSPYVKPIIAQARLELKSTSEGVLKSSEKGQYEVFTNDNCSDPTHSMLSKDHFSNVLNPIAGQVACATVKFVVPHIVDTWSDDGKDVRQVIDDILQVFHHPALRDENRQGQKAMFETVQAWWDGKEESEKQHLKEILSRDGVKDGKNHEGESAEGGHGHSHGASKKQSDSGFVPSAQEGAGFLSQIAGKVTQLALEETGLEEKLGTRSSNAEQRRTNESASYGDSAQNNRPSNEDSSYGRNETSSGGGSSYGRRNENENSYGRNDENESSSYNRQNAQNVSSYGRQNNEESSYSSNAETSYGSRNNNESSYGRNDDDETSSYGRRNESSYGRNNDNEQRENNRYTAQDESSYGRSDNNETSSYNRQSESTTYGQSSYSRNDNNEDNSYNRQSQSSYGRGSGNEQSSYSGNNDQESSYGRNTNRDDIENTQSGRNHRRGEDREESRYNSSYDHNENSSEYEPGRGNREERSDYGQREDREEGQSGYGRLEEESEGYGNRQYGGGDNSGY